jgi:sigma-B regulation protein RsbU (phosphoserine phosphatase)
MIKLSSIVGRKSHSWLLKRGRYTIGRSPECDLVMEDDTVSRKHAQIEIVDEQTIHLTDLGSHNGTTVNGRRISAPVPVTCGDVFAFGRVGASISSEEVLSVRDASIVITDSIENPANVTRLPMEKALEPLSSKILEDPRLFSSFSELGKMLILPGPEEQMFGKALELLRDILPVERVAVFSVQGQGKEIGLAACRTASSRGPGLFSISRTIAHELLTQRNAVLISDTEHDRKYAEQKSIVESRIRSAMAVPLFDEAEIAGILYADTTDPEQRYNEDCLRITATFGNILAAKIANCHLLKERQAKEVLEAELATASQIQQQLLPRELPSVERYRLGAFQIQCRLVGGDLYDVTTLDDGRILFLVADVSGKGMGAALLASNILASFRVLYSARDFNPANAVCSVSKQLLSFTRPGDFATLFLGILNPENDTLQYVNAGHDSPILVRHNGKVEHLEASGLPLGALDMAHWEEKTLELKVGDLLVAFTDGIPEAINDQDEPFGDEQLIQCIENCADRPPEELIESVVHSVDEFIGDVPRSDDITLLVLRRER